MTCWIGDQPFLKVNLDGARVCCETAPYDYPLHVAALQPEYKLASIWDSDYQNQIVAFHTIGCSRINMSDTVDAAGVPTGEGLSFPACDMMIGAAMEAGIVQQADTIEELAEKLRVDPAGLRPRWSATTSWRPRGSMRTSASLPRICCPSRSPRTSARFSAATCSARWTACASMSTCAC